ncbi:MAG: PQQ-binding-like beta-propeller repeat protein [Planctomycetota bacterium]
MKKETRITGIVLAALYYAVMFPSPAHAVVPVLVGPLQALMALLPAILAALGGMLLAVFKPSAMKKFLQLLWAQKLQVLATVAVIAGLVYGCQALFPGWSGPVKELEKADRESPMFRGGPERRGVADNMPGPVESSINWAFTKDVRTFYSTPSVVGNRVYATSADKGPFRDSGAVYCLDADTGNVVWKVSPKGFRATFSSPAVSGKYLVCGEGLHFTRDARVFCLDISDEKNVKILWDYRTKSHVESSPCIADGRVYVGAGDDGYYCFDLAPGPDGQAKVLWHTDTAKVPDAETCPAVAGGKVYVGLGVGGNGVACLDAATGAVAWKAATPYPVFGPPTVVGGKVIVGMGLANFIESEEQVILKETEKLKKKGLPEAELKAALKEFKVTGEVWALDAATGNPVWKFTAPRSVLGAVAAANDKLFFGCNDGSFFRLNMDGKKELAWNARAPVLTCPAVTDDNVYIVTTTGKLYGLSADTFELVLEHTVGTTGLFLSSPTVGRSHVYVGSSDFGLQCLGLPSGVRKEPVWAGHMGGAGGAGWIDGSPLPASGVLAGRYPEAPEGEETAPAAVISAPSAASRDMLFVPVADGARKGLAGLATGKKLAEKWFVATPNGVSISPAAGGDRVYVTDGGNGDGNRNLQCLDAATGNVKWKIPVAPGVSGAFLLAEDVVLVQDKPGVLVAVDVSGQAAWRRTVGEMIGTAAVAETVIAVAVKDPPSLALLDRVTGRELWRVPVEAGVTTGPVVRPDNVICVGTKAGVEARNPADGAKAWTADVGAVSGTLATARNFIAGACPGTSDIAILDGNGNILTRLAEALPGMPPVMARDALLYFSTTKEIRRVELEKWNPLIWTKTDFLGEVTSPAVLVNSQVYFGVRRQEDGKIGLVVEKGKKQ